MRLEARLQLLAPGISATVPLSWRAYAEALVGMKTALYSGIPLPNRSARRRAERKGYLEPAATAAKPEFACTPLEACLT